MAKNMNGNNVELLVGADKQVVAQGKSCTRILEVNITPPEIDSENERAPINLGLVLDRSGSMAGEKLDYVKQAAAHVVDLLGEQDRVSVTIYDDTVETIFPSEFMTGPNKAEAKNRILRVRSGSSTYLSGGWLAGCEEVAKGITDLTTNRTLLLTDGLANVGVRSIDELSYHSRQIYLRGIATSSFGVGEGYDEHLLEAMSNAGGGNFYFLETFNAIPLVFEREFTELVNVTLRDTEVSIKLPTGVKAEVLAGWHAEMVKERFVISLGSLYSGKNQSIYLKLHFEKNIAGNEITIPVTVLGKGDEDYLYEDKKSLTLKFVPASEEEVALQDKSLMERFALVDMAEKANEALKRERAGDRVGASRMMSGSINEHRTNLDPEIINKYDFLSMEMSEGMSIADRKRHHQEEYEIRRGQERIRHYSLHLVNGHLITEIEGQFALIDTGIPITIGKSEEFYFLNEIHQLSHKYMGVTVDYLEKMVRTPIDVVLGADILKKYFVTIDLQGKRVSFSNRLLIKPVSYASITDFMGAPIVNCKVGDSEHQMFIDTGSKLSYVSKNIAKNFSSIGTVTDFYPGIGEFETPVFNIPFKLGRSQFELRCGILPELLESTLLVTGKEGIIGSELYEKFIVCLAVPDRAIYMSNN